MLRDVVAGERGANDAFFKDEPVVDGGDGDGGGADVDYEGGRFAGCETGALVRIGLWWDLEEAFVDSRGEDTIPC